MISKCNNYAKNVVALLAEGPMNSNWSKALVYSKMCEQLLDRLPWIFMAPT